MLDVVLRPARPDEAGALSELALRSKAHWGYDEAFLAACRDDLTVSPDDCDGWSLQVAERAGQLLGFSRLAGHPPRVVLDDLWVEPATIGQGVGRLLLTAALERALAAGAAVLQLDADPHAEGFYRRAGAVRVGMVPSRLFADRALPRMEFRLPTG